MAVFLETLSVRLYLADAGALSIETLLAVLLLGVGDMTYY